MLKNFDILIAGNGPSAVSLAENTAKEGLKTLVVSPTYGKRWIPNYGSWYSDIEGLGLDLCIEESWASPMVYLGRSSVFELPYRYAKFSTPRLQTLLEVRSSREGVQFLCEKVVHVQHHEDFTTITLESGNKFNTKVFIDATGSDSSFMEKNGTAKTGYQSAYGLLLQVEGNHWERGEMSLMDYLFIKNLN